jgi:predicted MPP superfamily phosphohydrolase
LFAIFWLFGEDIYRTISFLFQKVFSTKENVSLENRRKFISQLAIFSAFIPLVVLTYGVLRNAYNYQFYKIKIGSNKVPSKFKGFKIVQLSDIHSGSFNQTKPIEEVVEKINALDPDLILFTGDLVNDLASEMDDYKAIFGKLKAKHGVYSILGNHDYGDYAFGDKASAEKSANFERFLEVHKEMKWDLIRNENRKIVIEDQSIDLIGVENTSANARFASHGDLSKAYGGLNKDSFKILMSHDPSHWDLEVNTKFQDIDLTLSGHTHGFQFGIETKYFKWSPSQYMYKQWAGLHQTGAQYLYVNRGFGNLGYPGRVGILPEVTVIELA